MGRASRLAAPSYPCWQRIEESEVRIHRLKVRRIRLAQISVQAAEHSGRGRNGRRSARDNPIEVERRQEAARDRLGVAFDAR